MIFSAFSQIVRQEITTVEQLFVYINLHQGENQLNDYLLQSAIDSIDEGQYNALIQCLQEAGHDVDFPAPE